MMSNFEGTLIGGEVINRTAVDRFTILHFISGFVYYSITARWIPMIANYPMIILLSVGWEIWEPMLKDWNPDVFPNPSKDSEINKVFDVLATVMGYAVAKAIQNVVVE